MVTNFAGKTTEAAYESVVGDEGAANPGPQRNEHHIGYALSCAEMMFGQHRTFYVIFQHGRYRKLFFQWFGNWYIIPPQVGGVYANALFCIVQARSPDADASQVTLFYASFLQYVF